MNDEDFFKEHPSLRGKLTYFLDKWFVDIELIDKTQVDHQKVQEICDDHFEFLQELVKVLDIHKDMPVNLDDWRKIITDRIFEIRKEKISIKDKEVEDD